MRRGPALIAVCVALGASPALAETRELAATLAESERHAGAEVVSLPTRFVYDGEAFAMSLPVPSAPRRCASVALIGARGLSFHVMLDQSPEAAKVSSAAGALEISSCDGGSLERLRFVSDAGRGALEVVVAFSDVPAPSLRDVLPERAPGGSAGTGEAGPPPALAPAVNRAEAFELRAKRDGALAVTRSVLTVGRDGSGGARVDVDAGCHRLELAASEARRRGRVDLDAEITSARDEALVARDRGDAADARLDFCLGAPAALRLAFVGATANEPVLVTHAFWPLPSAFGREWSGELRARVASAFVAHHAIPPVDHPVLEVIGGGGATPLSAEVEPGACYVAVVGLSHGALRSLRLRARVGELESSEERPPQEASDLVAFCARDRDRVDLEVDARGTSIAWRLAMFRVLASAGAR